MTERLLARRDLGPGARLPAVFPSLSITLDSNHACLSLRARADAFATIAPGMGLAPCTEPLLNCAAQAGVGVALRLGLDEWWWVVPAAEAEACMARVRSAASGLAHAVIDITHRTALLRIDGKGAVDALATGCALPLDVAAFPPGKCTRTVFDKAPIALWRVGEDAFRLTTEPSYLPYVAALLAHESTAPQH